MKRLFIVTVIYVLICGSANDFFGKLIYQLLPGHDREGKGLQIDWIGLWFLTAGTFFVCSLALFTKRSRKSFELFNRKIAIKLSFLSLLDLFMNSSKYLALIFVPAALVEITKNGAQLLFLALLRRFYRKKFLTTMQWCGFWVVFVGLMVISGEDLVEAFTENSWSGNTNAIGIAILIASGFIGAMRNTVEEVLMQHKDPSQCFDSDFLVGMEAIIAFLYMLLIGVVLVFTVYFPFDKSSNEVIARDWTSAHVTSGVIAVLCVTFVLFMASKYGRHTGSMRIAGMTSSLTRKFVQQLYPIGTWALSLIVYYAYSATYGEEWDHQQSSIRAVGFLFVIVGTYLYIRAPKDSKPKFEKVADDMPEEDKLEECDEESQAAEESSQTTRSSNYDLCASVKEGSFTVSVHSCALTAARPSGEEHVDLINSGETDAEDSS